jgi:ATP-binding cassette, subfamily B, multidrug efflux pump
MKALDLIKPYFTTHWNRIAAGLLALITVDILQLIIPRIIKRAIDDLTLYRADLSALLRYAGAVFFLAVLIGAFRYVWRRCLLGTARRLEEGLRNDLFGHIQTLSAPYFDRTTTGDLMARATNDINQVRMAAGMGLVAFNDAVVLGTAAIGFMLYIHVTLTIYVLIPMPLIVIAARVLGRRMHHRYQSVQAAFSDMTEVVRERFAGMRMIKAHNGQGIADRAVRNASNAYVNENMKLVGVTSAFFPLMLLLTNVSLAVVLYWGGRQTILQEITPGDFVAFISYLNLLMWPMVALGWVTNLIQRGGASLERLDAVLKLTPDIREPAGALPLARLEGRIAFESVSFGYGTGAGGLALDAISLSVAPGKILGIVGPPGSGKTTLLSLVPRLYDVSGGRITVDGHDLREVRLTDLRRQVAYAPQEPFLFAGTIRDNLLFGCPEDCRDRLDRVIDDAGLSALLKEFPTGLETVVGEKGILLSGGQKQRVALARALLVDAPVLLLDDPISQVDATTGDHIVNAIGRLAGRTTIVIVSHRLSALRFADWIVSLDRGRIVESGHHDQLLAGNGYYARVHALQELENAV